MALTANPSLLLIAGTQPNLILVDIEKGIVQSQFPAQGRYILMKKCRHICAATDDGHVHVLNVNDYQLLTSWKAHSSKINDMDARHDFLVTCGLSLRHMGQPMIDPMANVYDLKNLKPLPPMPFPAGASYVRLHPKLSTTSFVTSNTGQMQVVDLMNTGNVMMRQANVQYMLGMEIASSGDALVIQDINNVVYLWGSPSKIRFNNVSKETEFGGPPPQSLPRVDWIDSPLNAIGMPYYSEALLSNWPSHMVYDVGAPPPTPDHTLTQYVQPAELGHYGPNLNLQKLKRYQVVDTRHDEGSSTITAPKFLSEQAKDLLDAEKLEQYDGVAAATAGLKLDGRAQTEKERMLKYSNVEIKYSRFGVDDFDFSFYNKTQYSGLETHIKNSFINALLQLYKFIPLIRNVAIQHASTSCVKPNCILCEFGFLFDMLEKAEGLNCQATNLLHAFSSLGEARSLNLLESPALANYTTLSNTIQSANRFFMKQIALDYASMASSTDGVDEILSTRATEAIRCLHCANVTSKPASLYVHDMVYPNIDPKHNPRLQMFKFSSILKASMERELKHRGFCNKCRRYQQLQTRKSTTTLPYVLLLNAALVNPAMHSLWETPGWLPLEIGIVMHNRNIYIYEGPELMAQLRNRSSAITVYELVGFVADIDTTEKQHPHLVSLVNVDISKKPAPGVNGKWGADWHLFNDFLVSPVETREALHFDRHWKLPSVVAYQVKSARGKIDETWKSTLDASLIHGQYSINGIACMADCEVLGDDERPQSGTLIALDTEFVELERAELDIKADGTQETIRPARSGLARVSVLRGEGRAEGQPFIDDYITIFDPIVDYKTQYSGIKPGDLDVRMSRHNLVPLKVAYKKLWTLLNLGCVFIGHGLVSDFRKANIHVPKSQTIDTQSLYLIPGKNRRFSLKYLAWAVFKEFIQEEPAPASSHSDSGRNARGDQMDGHDSIEDARMALRLYRKYQEYEAAGIVEQVLEEIWNKGRRWGWKPPSKSVGGAYLGEGMNGSAVPSGRNTPEAGMMSGDGGLTPTPRKGMGMFSSPPLRYNAPIFSPGQPATAMPTGSSPMTRTTTPR